MAIHRITALKPPIQHKIFGVLYDAGDQIDLDDGYWEKTKGFWDGQVARGNVTVEVIVPDKVESEPTTKERKRR